jgi:hypothetical protein
MPQRVIHRRSEVQERAFNPEDTQEDRSWEGPCVTAQEKNPCSARVLSARPEELDPVACDRPHPPDPQSAPEDWADTHVRRESGSDLQFCVSLARVILHPSSPSRGPVAAQDLVRIRAVRTVDLVARRAAKSCGGTAVRQPALDTEPGAGRPRPSGSCSQRSSKYHSVRFGMVR